MRINGSSRVERKQINQVERSFSHLKYNVATDTKTCLCWWLDLPVVWIVFNFKKNLEDHGIRTVLPSTNTVVLTVKGQQGPLVMKSFPLAG